MTQEERTERQEIHRVGTRRLYFRSLALAFVDALYVCGSIFFALWVRYELSIEAIEDRFLNEAVQVLPFAVGTFLLVYFIFRLYHSIWRYASVGELTRIIGAYMVLVPVLILEIRIFHIQLPRSVYLISYMVDFLMCLATRFGYRFVRQLLRRRANAKDVTDRVMIIGAGNAARELIADIAISEHVNYQVVCIIDDNPAKWGRYLGSAQIVGGREEIVDAAKKYQVQRIIFAIPTASNKERAEILDVCKDTGCHLQVIPGMYQLVNGEVSVSRLKDVEITDLLGRDEIVVNDEEISRAIHGKVVMVTGGGGSIGSELCRQIAEAGPELLIIFDIYENNAYAIEQELKKTHPELAFVTLIGSVRNTNRIKHVLEKYHPEVIYHAAAHKHVPLMEESPNEAVKNNCLGTYKVASMAAEHGVKRFLLISTDKAVNPTNVMGATKRICEMVIQMLDRKYPDTTFCAVRFGNVLGSNGSVIPLFKDQIASGGPVTVTDKNIIRYFMTIPEAVSLVLQAGHYAKGGEIFVLDMGEPVRIDDMARKMIELSGYTPDVDIEIRYTGLRPGEKLYEELLIDKSTMRRTDNQKIFIEQPYPMDDEEFMAQLDRLGEAATAEYRDIRPLIRKIVPTYTPKKNAG